MQNRNIVILVIALAISGICVFLLNAYFSGREERVAAIAEEQQLARIVVATQPLEFGQPLTPQNVRLQNFPAASVPEGAFSTIELALANGRVALRPIVPGEPILASKVSGEDGRAVLAANIPEGKRAVSIQVGAVTGVSGFVRPGDTVDVILTRQIPGDGADATDLMSDVVMNRVKVLAIDQIASESATEPSVGNTATLEVDIDQAQKLAIASRLGTLTLALRNIETVDNALGQTVTTRDVGSNRYYIRRRTPAATQQASFSPPATVPAATHPAAQFTKPVRTGPLMTIYRGTEGEDYSVGRLGGN